MISWNEKEYRGNVEGVKDITYNKMMEHLSDSKEPMMIRARTEIHHLRWAIDRLKNCDNCKKDCKGHATEPELHCWVADLDLH